MCQEVASVIASIFSLQKMKLTSKIKQSVWKSIWENLLKSFDPRLTDTYTAII